MNPSCCSCENWRGLWGLSDWPDGAEKEGCVRWDWKEEVEMLAVEWTTVMRMTKDIVCWHDYRGSRLKVEGVCHSWKIQVDVDHITFILTSEKAHTYT